MKMKKISAVVIAFVLSMTGFAFQSDMASANETRIIMDGAADLTVKPGETSHIRLPIKSDGDFIPIYDASVADTDIFTFTKPVFKTQEGFSAYGIPTDKFIYAEFDVTVLETVGIGSYPVTLTVLGQILNNMDTSPRNLELSFKLMVREEKSPAQLTVDNVYYRSSKIGTDTDLNFTVNNEGEISALNTYITLDYGDSGIAKRYTANRIKIGDLKPGENYKVSLPVRILPTASAGTKTLTVNFEYKDVKGTPIDEVSYKIYFDIKGNEDAPQLDIVDLVYPDNLKPGDEFVLKAAIQNFGSTKAYKVTVTVDGENAESGSFYKNYYADVIKVADIKAEEKKDAQIPLIVSENASGSLNKLNLLISFTDDLGVSYSKTKTVYLKVATGSPEELKSSLIISNVKQSPAHPVAGERMKVSFDIRNKGNMDINELKVGLDGLSEGTFIPVESEPYMYIEKLAAGATKSITLNLMVSDDIPEGMNNLTVVFKSEGVQIDSVNIPILNVKNDTGSSSKPILIISNYTADSEELRAGSTFNFTFEIYNTHSSMSAKNITVTLKQDEGIFSPTQGGNNFFIAKIGPGETVTQNLEMKVKSDAQTGTYKLKVDIAYEYDGIKPNPTTGDIGENKNYELMLRAIENARPVVDYVNIYSYEGMVVAGNPAMLSFAFYNMGKSTLNNVIATVEGDFTKSDGSMYVLGNVMSGDSSYAEFEVIPNMEGLAKGVLKITYEDSNGDEVVFTKEFETEIMSPQIFDPGMGGDGGIDVFNPSLPEAKKPILKTWLYVLINIAIFIAFIPITRAVIISVYKKKLHRREEENIQ